MVGIIKVFPLFRSTPRDPKVILRVGTLIRLGADEAIHRGMECQQKDEIGLIWIVQGVFIVNG